MRQSQNKTEPTSSRRLQLQYIKALPDTSLYLLRFPVTRTRALQCEGSQKGRQMNKSRLPKVSESMTVPVTLSM